jgi:hypothetical protein
MDSDGDGIGDIPRITSRLDHLVRLGVDVLWHLLGVGEMGMSTIDQARRVTESVLLAPASSSSSAATIPAHAVPAPHGFGGAAANSRHTYDLTLRPWEPRSHRIRLS